MKYFSFWQSLKTKFPHLDVVKYVKYNTTTQNFQAQLKVIASTGYGKKGEVTI